MHFDYLLKLSFWLGKPRYLLKQKPPKSQLRIFLYNPKKTYAPLFYFEKSFSLPQRSHCALRNAYINIKGSAGSTAEVSQADAEDTALIKT